jgi:hypothetical protein
MSCFDSGQRRDIVDWVFTAPAQAGPYEYPLQTVVPGLQSVEYDTVRLSRVFDDVDVTNGGAFHTNLSGVPNEPYEYKLLSRQLGLVLFSPAGYNFTIRTRRGQGERLIGRVSYDVYDWRILREEFRAPDQGPYQYRLALGSLKVAGNQGPDGKTLQGIGIQVPDGAGNFADADLALQDVATGALYAFKEGTNDPNQTSFHVDKSLGLITLLDHDPAPGTQVWAMNPGDATMTSVTVDGRSLRAMYMGRGEWAAQVLKPAARYVQTYGRPGIGQYYVGGSNGSYILTGNRIYFPPADAGRLVSLGEVYYTNNQGVAVGPVQLTAKLQTNNMEQGLPYIQMDAYYPDFASFDYSYGTAVKNVKGASVAVRVLWNPETFN